MNGTDSLLEAIQNADSVAVRKMLAEEPALVEATGAFGQTPLMCAVSCPERCVDVIRVILGAGAQVNRQTAEGYTALHCAVDVDGEARWNTVEVLNLLIGAGASLDLRQHYGWTPLFRAVVEGTATEVRTLLAAGSNPNDTLPDHTLPAFNAGRTMLMAALTSPYAEELVDALLRAGADPLRRDAGGQTFFEYARAMQAESSGAGFASRVGRCAEIARRFAVKGV